VVVNGKKYHGTMTPLNYLSDDQIANVLTYVRNSFGNEGASVSADDVKRVRATIAPPTVNQFE
jgi:nitrite reductase (NO-forming)